MSFTDSVSFTDFGKSQYALDIEAKNEGMLLEPRAYPTIEQYYEASSHDDSRPLVYQHGLSNYSSLHLGDDRITFKKSLAKSTFVQESVSPEKMSVITDAHLRNKTKSSKTRHADYLAAIEMVGERRVTDLENLVRERFQDCTRDNVALMRKAFHHFDRDNSGGLDIREFHRALSRIGFDFTEIEVLALFGKYDADCEGYINFSLFREGMVRGHTPNRRFVHTGFSTAFGDDDVGDDEDEEADREELRHMQEQRISEHFDDVSGGRGSVDAAGVERLLDKLQASQRSRQVILKCVADSSNVSLEEFIELWFSS